MKTDTWSLIHAERAALAGDLADLDDGRWATPSLCTGLTVREVLAHLAAGASLRFPRWMAGVIRCRFDFDKQVAMRLSEHLGTSPAETLAAFSRFVTSTTSPVGWLAPTVTYLGETIVHAEDIRRPLGIRRDYAIGVVTQVAEYYRGSDLVVVAKGRVGGLRLAATDAPSSPARGRWCPARPWHSSWR